MAEERDALIRAEGPDTCAAFFADPVQISAGVVLPPRTYFEKIQAVLREHDMLLVADEVACGFGRTGDMWGCDTYGLEPDMMVCAKALAASFMPISTLLVNDRIYEAMVVESEKVRMFAHGFTYGAHPVTTAVALETLKIYEEIGLLDRVRAIAPGFQRRFSALVDPI